MSTTIVLGYGSIINKVDKSINCVGWKHFAAQNLSPRTFSHKLSFRQFFYIFELHLKVFCCTCGLVNPYSTQQSHDTTCSRQTQLTDIQKSVLFITFATYTNVRQLKEIQTINNYIWFKQWVHTVTDGQWQLDYFWSLRSELSLAGQAKTNMINENGTIYLSLQLDKHISFFCFPSFYVILFHTTEEIFSALTGLHMFNPYIYTFRNYTITVYEI